MTAAAGWGLARGLRPTRYDLAFLIVWLLALGALAAGGDRSDLVQGVLAGPVFGGLYLITRRITDPAPAPGTAHRNVIAGGIVVVLVVALTMWETIPRDDSGRVGAWSALHWGITARLAPLFGWLDPGSLDNTIRYVVMPGVVLVLLGWRAADLGFGRSRRGTPWTVVVWSLLPLVVYGALAFAIGHGKLGQLAHRFFIDIFRNGFAEEIFFRGMVLRVSMLAFGTSAGNVAQALVFGLCHIGADLRDVHGIPWLACADAVGTQAIAGYFFGLFTQRTGNVLAAGTAHALLDGGAIFT